MLEKFVFRRLLCRPCSISDPVQRITEIGQDAWVELV